MGSVFALRLSSARFLPLLDLDRAVQATRLFTTLADGQRKAIFHFYFQARPGSNWLPVGRVEWDSLSAAPAGEPTLELRLTPGRAGSLLLRLRERSSGASRSYRIRLPAFRRTTPTAPARAAPARAAPAARKGSRRRTVVALAIAAALLAVTAVAAFRFTALRGLLAERLEPKSRTPAGARGSGVTRQPAAVKPPAPEPAPPPEPPPRPRPQPQALAQEEPPAEALSHRVQWGDTLWRITERYYGDPYLYDLLAGENALPDPNLLIPGTEIRLPPRIDDQHRKQ